MEEITYKIRLTKTSSIQIEEQQTDFMSKVFALAAESGIVGNGIDIVLV